MEVFRIRIGGLAVMFHVHYAVRDGSALGYKVIHTQDPTGNGQIVKQINFEKTHRGDYVSIGPTDLKELPDEMAFRDISVWEVERRLQGYHYHKKNDLYYVTKGIVLVPVS